MSYFWDLFWSTFTLFYWKELKCCYEKSFLPFIFIHLARHTKCGDLLFVVHTQKCNRNSYLHKEIETEKMSLYIKLNISIQLISSSIFYMFGHTQDDDSFPLFIS